MISSSATKQLKQENTLQQGMTSRGNVSVSCEQVRERVAHGDTKTIWFCEKINRQNTNPRTKSKNTLITKITEKHTLEQKEDFPKN